MSESLVQMVLKIRYALLHDVAMLISCVKQTDVFPAHVVVPRDSLRAFHQRLRLFVQNPANFI